MIILLVIIVQGKFTSSVAGHATVAASTSEEATVRRVNLFGLRLSMRPEWKGGEPYEGRSTVTVEGSACATNGCNTFTIIDLKYPGRSATWPKPAMMCDANTVFQNPRKVMDTTVGGETAEYWESLPCEGAAFAPFKDQRVGYWIIPSRKLLIQAHAANQPDGTIPGLRQALIDATW